MNFQDIPIIAADGGAIRLFNLGILPDYIVGDLDTFERFGLRSFFLKSEIVYRPSQDINDFEKALIFAIEKGFKNILITGFHGGFLEHTLNNWSVLQKYSNKLKLCVYDQKRYAIPIDFSFKFEANRNEIISIIPQPSAILRTQNLKWNLNEEILALGYREGARNFAVGKDVKVEILKGSVLLIIDARLPYCYKKIESGPDEIRTHDL
ncbi:MAG: thiamine diphosphokinase [Candidatus Kapaibacteriales bacterium]